MAPKDQNNSSQEIDTTISISVMLFKKGVPYTYTNLFRKLGLGVSRQQIEAWKKEDQKRVAIADYQSRSGVKERRKKLKRAKVKRHDAFVHQEGATYKSKKKSSGKKKSAIKGIETSQKPTKYYNPYYRII